MLHRQKRRMDDGRLSTSSTCLPRFSPSCRFVYPPIHSVGPCRLSTLPCRVYRIDIGGNSSGLFYTSVGIWRKYSDSFRIRCMREVDSWAWMDSGRKVEARHTDTLYGAKRWDQSERPGLLLQTGRGRNGRVPLTGTTRGAGRLHCSSRPRQVELPPARARPGLRTATLGG